MRRVIEYRDYQTEVIAKTLEAFNKRQRRVVIASPTGSGKTVIMMGIIERAAAAGARVLIIVHRRELIDQILTYVDAGVICSGYEPDPDNTIQVATVQSLLSRKVRPRARLVIFDEVHHYAAESWREIQEEYKFSRILGLTATPVRADGKPLGNFFDKLIVAAQYPDLIEQGHLVDVDVVRPAAYCGSDLAQDPLEAYVAHGDGRQCIAFTRFVSDAEELAEAFRDAGISAKAVTGDTDPITRLEAVTAFRDGELQVLVNVYVLTEGFDAPAASCLLLARGCGHVSTYLQMCGRVLRPAPGKDKAVIIDLPGVSHVHGLPTQRRHYTLETGIVDESKPVRVKDCPSCGNAMHPQVMTCDSCGHIFVPDQQARPRIFDRELLVVFAGSNTPDYAKDKELTRLRELAARRGYGGGWVAREYRKIFGRLPEMTNDEKRSGYFSDLEWGKKNGYKPNFAKVRYFKLWGHWPTW